MKTSGFKAGKWGKYFIHRKFLCLSNHVEQATVCSAYAQNCSWLWSSSIAGFYLYLHLWQTESNWFQSASRNKKKPSSLNMTVPNLVWEGLEELEMFSVEKRNYAQDMIICFLHLKNCYLERVCSFVYKVYELKRGRLGAFHREICRHGKLFILETDRLSFLTLKMF